MKNSDRIFVAGARGMVGSAIVRALLAQGYANVLTPGRDALDLKDAAAVLAFILKKDARDPWTVTAALSSAHRCGVPLAKLLAGDPPNTAMLVRLGAG